MLYASIFFGLITFACQNIHANPPELAPRFQRAIINLILTPRLKHTQSLQKKTCKKEFISYDAIECAEQTYENELFSFAFMPHVSPAYTGLLTANVSFLRDFVTQHGPCEDPEDYLELLFLPHERLEEKLGIAPPTTQASPTRTKKRGKKVRFSMDNNWRQVLSDFECIKRLCEQFKMLMKPNSAVVHGKKKIKTLIEDYDDSLTNEDYPLERLAKKTKRLSVAADDFRKTLASTRRSEHIIFEIKACHLKLFKKILLRYLKEIPNSAFLQFPEYWRARNACKKKRIDCTITAINDWSDELIEQEFEFLTMLREQPRSRVRSYSFEPGCFGTQTNEGLA